MEVLTNQTGSDATAHMAEETKHAATVVPKAMITSYMINAALGFVMTVTFCFILVDYENAQKYVFQFLGMSDQDKR